MICIVSPKAYLAQHKASQLSTQDSPATDSSTLSESIVDQLNELRPRVESVARRFFRCEADCQDVVQETFLAAIRSYPRFRHQSGLATWLHRIAVNVCKMKRRSLARRSCLPLSEEANELPAREESEPLWSDDDRRLLAQALKHLPEKYRLVIQLRYFEQFSTAQTAALLGVSCEAVKTRLHRGCRALRELVERSVASNDNSMVARDQLHK